MNNDTDQILSSLSRHSYLDALQIEQLERQGARAQWRRCGETGRLCVRIDRHAPIYGEHGDYYVLHGY